MEIQPSKSNKWTPIGGDLFTPWTLQVTSEAPFPEYPRPQMTRAEWKNLNGLWNYVIADKNIPKEEIKEWEGKILVPFPVESALSGVKQKLFPHQYLWYHRTFSLPKNWEENLNHHRILLHFGGVDWQTKVWVDDREVFFHEGGDVPFSVDITPYLKTNQKENTQNLHDLTIRVWDPSDKGHQERGKQKLKPHTVFYTAMSGIWQTIWLEMVSDPYIYDFQLKTDIDLEEIDLEVNFSKPNEELSDFSIIIEISEDGTQISSKKIKMDDLKQKFSVPVKNPKLWSPSSPFLYDLKITLLKDGNGFEDIIDEVKSYFGMRKIAIKRGSQGIPRIELNNKFFFQYGLLDQGWWPDGLYTAPNDQALKWDLEKTKAMGFNMVRKHIKIEPARWYYHCDKLGLLVWQDIPSGGVYGNWNWGIQMFIAMFLKKSWWTGRKKKKIQQNFYYELEQTVSNLFNFACIVVWVPFNEGWGQFHTKKVTNYLRSIDESRLIDSASGWTDYGCGDLHTIHRYPGPAIPKIKSKSERGLGLSEFGGFGFEIHNHIWKTKLKKWGYRNLKSKLELETKYSQLIKNLKPLIKKGLSAAIYTQTTDVEQEINGLISYDRKIIKLEPEWLKNLHKTLYEAEN
ncbi:glycoside hydrolase family 2 protein [Promethearchaeum syntrophicum]|uniref:Glycoside hydrolase family 2 protein n=1 Tax=Promethearchaeum syntrophicum TaxID=2594042 RepID=A0A5B9DAF0_9ARCH|nr:sugar-binding domain-containing protein [Candidatus Prometheoarchaeum syntrophicum]QEE15935.1 beta-D-glucuronidase [Candidatus Prometheoarchaeum syntrophicum]